MRAEAVCARRVGREGMHEEGCAKRGGREEAVREQCVSATPGHRPVSRAWIGKPEVWGPAPGALSTY